MWSEYSWYRQEQWKGWWQGVDVALWSARLRSLCCKRKDGEQTVKSSEFEISRVISTITPSLQSQSTLLFLSQCGEQLPPSPVLRTMIYSLASFYEDLLVYRRVWLKFLFLFWVLSPNLTYCLSWGSCSDSLVLFILYLLHVESNILPLWSLIRWNFFKAKECGPETECVLVPFPWLIWHGRGYVATAH